MNMDGSEDADLLSQKQLYGLSTDVSRFLGLAQNGSNMNTFARFELN